jgi:hypothetical protein
MWINECTEKDTFPLPYIDMIYVISQAMPSVWYIWIFVVLITISTLWFWFTRVFQQPLCCTNCDGSATYGSTWLYVHFILTMDECIVKDSFPLSWYGLCHKLCTVNCRMHFDLRYAYNHINCLILFYMMIIAGCRECFWRDLRKPLNNARPHSGWSSVLVICLLWRFEVILLTRVHYLFIWVFVTMGTDDNVITKPFL